jgi:hypothetical protein
MLFPFRRWSHEHVHGKSLKLVHSAPVSVTFIPYCVMLNVMRPQMPMDHPKSYRSIAAWKNIRMGRAPSVSVGRDVHSVMTEKGFGRNGKSDSSLALKSFLLMQFPFNPGSSQSHTNSPLLPAPAVLSRKTTGSNSNNDGNPPTYYRPPSFGYSSYEK